MSGLIQDSTAQLALWAFILLVLVIVLFLVVRRSGDHGDEDQPVSSELLTKFREIHARGGLSDEEYRTIKTQLGDQLQQELKENEEKG